MLGIRQSNRPQMHNTLCFLSGRPSFLRYDAKVFVHEIDQVPNSLEMDPTKGKEQGT
jgi:hypothetical protein